MSATRAQLEFVVERLQKQNDALLSPIERGANDARRTLLGVVHRWIVEQSPDYVDDELLLQICGALGDHVALRKEQAAEDIRELWDLCFERTLHLLDEDDKQILREKGLLE